MKNVYGTRSKGSNSKMSELPLCLSDVIKPINSHLLYSLTGHVMDSFDHYVIFFANETYFCIEQKYFANFEITPFTQFFIDGYIMFDEGKKVLIIRDCTIYESRVKNKQRGTPFTDLHSMKGIILQTQDESQGRFAWIFGLYMEMKISKLCKLDNFSWFTFFFFENGRGFFSALKEVPFKQKVVSNNLMIYSPVLYTLEGGNQKLWGPLFGYLECDKNSSIFSRFQQDYYHNVWVERPKYACEDAKWKIASTSKELSTVVDIADSLRLCTLADSSRLPNLLRKMVIDKIARFNANLASAGEDVDKHAVNSPSLLLKRSREETITGTSTVQPTVVNKCEKTNGAIPSFESSAIKKQKTCEKEEGNATIVEDIKPSAFDNEDEVRTSCLDLENEATCNGNASREGVAVVTDLNSGLKEELSNGNSLQNDEPLVEEDHDSMLVEAICLHVLSDKYLLMYSTSISLPYFAVERNRVVSPLMSHWYKLVVLRNYTLIKESVKGRDHLIVFNVKCCESLSVDTKFKPPFKYRLKKNRVELHVHLYVGNRSLVDGCAYCYSVELPPIIDTSCLIPKNTNGEFSAWCALRNFPYRGTEWTLVSSLRKKVTKLSAKSENKLSDPKPTKKYIKKEAILKEVDVLLNQINIKASELSTVKQTSSVPNSVSGKVPLNFNLSQEYTGFICSSMSANVDYYVVHCRELKLNVLLEKKKFTNEEYVNPIGEWIRFVGEEINCVLYVQKYEIVSSECTTMPTFSQLLISCDVEVPKDFDTRTVLTTDHVAEVHIVDETVVAEIQREKKFSALVACDVECKASDPNELKFQLINLRDD